jgi:hypothetical protein
MFPHCSIHNYTWTCPGGKTHNQIDHVVIDRRRHSSILDVQSFRGADCDTYRYLVVAKVREYLKDNINEIESNSKNKKIRDLHRGIN